MTNFRNKNNSFSKLIRLVITIVIVWFVISTIMSFFNRPEEVVVDDTPVTNNYVTNHTVSYETNTDIDNVEVINTSTPDGVRDKFTKIKGNNQDDVTVMVYMIGTDLESQYGMGTSDINEILAGMSTNNMTVVLQTGGCKRWRNTVMKDTAVRRLTLTSEDFSLLQTVGNVPMTNPDTLSDFIEYSADNFPANRYILILWDHGGGSAVGYGYDEVYPNYPSMSPDVIAKALKKANVKFDFIGFDACLMANLETAIAVEPYADYLVGSEETEPGEGWDYENWIRMLDNNTSTPTLTIAKQIIDDYVASSKKSGGEITQSVIDLGELVYNIKEPLVTFSKSTTEKLNGNDYQSVAIARSNTKEFSKSSGLDQVDLVDLVNKFNVKGSSDLAKGIKSAIKYNKTYNINNAYGLSAYFPYSSLSKVNSMVQIYDNINMDEDFSSVVKSFATYASSGQIVTQNSGSSSSSLFDLLLGNQYYTNDNYYSYDNYSFDNYYGNDYSGYGYQDSFGTGYDEWMGNAMVDIMSSFFRSNNVIKPSSLQLVKKDNQNVVCLSEDEWNLVDNITLNMFINDGEGYIDLGKDNVFDFNNAGDLIVETDGTWLAINDKYVVSYEFVSEMYIDDTNYKTVGKIPAYLNDQRVDLIVNFTPENENGIILGAQIVYGDTDVKPKGLIEIKDGDEIKFVANYYKYDGTFVDEFQIGDTLIVNGGLSLNNVHLDNDYVYAYCLRDIYGSNMWTPKTEVNN